MWKQSTSKTALFKILLFWILFKKTDRPNVSLTSCGHNKEVHSFHRSSWCGLRKNFLNLAIWWKIHTAFTDLLRMRFLMLFHLPTKSSGPCGQFPLITGTQVHFIAADSGRPGGGQWASFRKWLKDRFLSSTQRFRSGETRVVLGICIIFLSTWLILT